ncbi:uncharacterized protein LOC142324670 [Lycorma delicatula]|uniref:uncharacterized protein LOC142324670 n=1 Tax=Lycorma delicatula TaxID=130591 RepID=UPI003F515772
MENVLSLQKEDLLESYKLWKSEQKVIAVESVTAKRRRNRRKTVVKAKKVNDENNESKLKALPEEFLEKLASNESNTKKVRNSNTSVKNRSTRKQRLKITSALIDDADYIPLDSNLSSTDFKLVRLDKDPSNSMTKTAVDFYNRRLYGKHINRVQTKSLFIGADKIKAKLSAKKKN